VEKSLDHLERQVLSRRLGRQALASLGATAGDDAAATNSCHTGAEAMAALADDIGWLKGALHVRTPIFLTKPLILKAKPLSLAINNWSRRDDLSGLWAKQGLKSTHSGLGKFGLEGLT
jgi:hypothetical protein